MYSVGVPDLGSASLVTSTSECSIQRMKKLQLGLWPLLYVFAQPEGLQMEPQAYLHGLQRVVAELADQTSQTIN